MKSFLTLIMICIPVICISQDLIIDSEGQEIQGKVIEITLDEVKYQDPSLTNGPIISLPNSNLLLVRFSNGKTHVFKDKGPKFKIGQEHEGGVIVHIDPSGNHGLIAAKQDVLNFKTMWGPNSNIGAYSPSDGRDNTDRIIRRYKDYPRRLEKTAANACQNFKSEGYEDWYLPAIDELKWVYQNKDKVPNLKAGDYCSSTEMRRDDAYSIHFRPHRRDVFYYNKDNKDYYIRCVRKF